MNALTSAPKSHLLILCTLVLSCACVYEYTYAAEARDEIAEATAERDRLRAENDTTEANYRSAEAVAAWTARVEETERTWKAYLETLPATDRVDQTFADLRAVAAGSDLRAFEREKKTEPAAGGLPPGM